MKNLLWIILIIGGIIGAVLFFQRKASQAATAGDKPGDKPPMTKPAESFPLKPGDKGQLVEKLQKWLNWAFNSALTVDGIFGPKTQAAWNSNGPVLYGWKKDQVTKSYFDMYIQPNV